MRKRKQSEWCILSVAVLAMVAGCGDDDDVVREDLMGLFAVAADTTAL
jgi:hypothetical protein